MADFRLGRLKFKWQGAWTASTAYVIDDIVKYGGNSYVCTTNHTSAANENLFYSSDGAKWSLHLEGIVNKGDWATATWYKVNDVVKYGNNQYLVTTGHTSGASFSTTNHTTYLEGLKFESTWASGTFQKGDIVTYGGYSYVGKVDSFNSTITPNADTTNWDVITTGFKNRLEYQAGTAYVPGDVVRYGGNTYVNKVTSTGNAPSATAYWDLLSEGFNWTGNWANGTDYLLGDVVSRSSNSYVCIQANSGNDPSTDTNGTYWNYVAQGGSAAQVLTTTGDMLYQSAGTIARLGLPAGSTGTAAEKAAASGQVLTVGGGANLLPQWETNNTSAPVFYVTKEGSDSNNGKQISRGFASIRYATDYVSALTGSDAPSATNPISIYVKAGIYEETLPIHIPAFVSILGDNIRTTVVNAASGNSSELNLELGSALTHIRNGDVVSNDSGTKTGKIIDNPSTTKVTIIPLTGGAWTTTDKYVDIVSNKNADASDLLTSNKTYIAHEVYHRHVANVGAVSGVEATVKSRLEAYVTDVAYNVKHGGNNKVFEYGAALTSGTAITGNNTQDTALLNYINTVAGEVVQNINVTESSGNSQTQTMFSGTTDTGSPKCSTAKSAITTLVNIITTGISNGNMNATTKTDTYIAISAVNTVPNAESTMVYLADHTIVKDMVFGGMTGFAAGSPDKNIEAATVKGVYFRLDPASAVTKSPYVQNCSAIGGAGVGVIIDGGAHKHFDNSATPSFKSACFDAYTQVLEGGVGFWCRGSAAMEIVSSFTYYAHISYISTGGGRIRAVSGNSSYGKYGCLSRGFDADEATTDGTVAGLRIQINPAASKSGTFQANEEFTGGTSGAIGQLRSDQISTADYIYYLPIKGTFANGELLTGTTSSATVTTAASSAVTGAKGFTAVVEGLTAAPDQGGSVQYTDNGSNNDAGSYVISASSYSAPDGRGSITSTRGQLATSAAAHDGASVVALFPTQAVTTTTLTAGINNSVTNVDVSALTNIVQNGYIIIDNELMIVTGFVDADTITVTRAQEGTSAAAHSQNASVTVVGAKVTSQDKLISDLDNSSTNVRVAQAGISFKATDYIKIDNEFMKLTAAAADTTGIVILNFADEKTVAAGDGQAFKIRYKYSQVRLTAHDFLDVGTGNRANTNWPYLPLSANIPSQEVDEERPGRVYYVSTDQDGNFAVGNFFKVQQSTGKATLNANAFDLTGLDTLRLGAIGAQLGATIDEFSTDGTLTQNSDEKVPTQKAVKTYVDAQTSGTSLSIAGTSGTGAITLGSQTLTIAGTANEIEAVAGSQTITIGLPNNVTIGNNLTITGDLTVNGATTTVSTTNTTVSDKLFELGTGTTGSGSSDDCGIIIERGSDDNVFIGWDESQDVFRIATTSATGASTGGLSLTDAICQFGDISTTRLTTNEVLEVFNHDTGGGINSTTTINCASNAVHFLDTDSAGNFTLNMRGTSTLTLNNMMPSGTSITIAVIYDSGGTSHYPSGALQIDGSTSWGSVRWAGGEAPVADDAKANSSSVLTYSILKTGANAYRVLGTFTSFKS